MAPVAVEESCEKFCCVVDVAPEEDDDEAGDADEEEVEELVVLLDGVVAVDVAFAAFWY